MQLDLDNAAFGKKDAWEVDRKNVTMLEMIGHGAYGTVNKVFTQG